MRLFTVSCWRPHRPHEDSFLYGLVAAETSDEAEDVCRAAGAMAGYVRFETESERPGAPGLREPRLICYAPRRNCQA